MEGYAESSYGDAIAAFYDGLYEGLFDGDATAGLLGELAGGGPVLELGIGTGRIALRLVEQGLEVHGIDASEAMLAKLKRKPRGSEVRLFVGDFGKVEAGGPYSLVFVVFNTLFGLSSMDAQVDCFKNVAAALAPGGA